MLYVVPLGATDDKFIKLFVTFWLVLPYNTIFNILKEISLYSAVFTFAQKELFILSSNAFFSLKKPRKPKPRNRRILQSEIDKILAELKYEVGNVPRTSGQYVAWAFLFAIETEAAKLVEKIGGEAFTDVDVDKLIEFLDEIKVYINK